MFARAGAKPQTKSGEFSASGRMNPNTPAAHRQPSSRAIGNQAALRLLRQRPRLTIYPVNDAHERQADAMADQVMHGPAARAAPLQSGGAIVQRACGACEAKETLDRKAQDGAATAGPAASGAVRDVLGSAGQPLDPAARQFLEPRFGQDFSQVRVHTDGAAAHSARLLGALAYTTGQDVVFGAGQYAPHTGAGRRLLAHELVHVVQQAGNAAHIQRQPDAGDGGPAAMDNPDQAGGAVPAGPKSGTCKIKIYSGKGCPESTLINTCALNTCCPALDNHFAMSDGKSTSSFKGSCSGPALETRTNESEKDCNWFYRDADSEQFLFGAMVDCPVPIS